MIETAVKGKRRPKYERLREYLMHQISTGQLKPGDALPSELHLTAVMGLARNTVRDALGILEQDGLIERVQGKGTFVQRDVLTQIRGSRDIYALVAPEQGNLYAPLLDTLSSAAHVQQSQVISATTNDQITRQAEIVLQLMERNVAGVVLVPPTSPDTPTSHITQLQRVGIPVVICHRGVKGVRAPLIRFSGQEIGRLAGETLLAQGHRRVGCLPTMRYNLTDDIISSLRATLQAAGGDVPEDLVAFSGVTEDCSFSEEGAIAALRKLLMREDRPTALLVPLDVLSEYVCLVLARSGIRIPEDISIIGFGETHRRGPLQKSLCTVVLDEHDIGQRAFDLLQQIISGDKEIHDESVTTVSLSVRLGSTVGAAPSTVRALQI